VGTPRNSISLRSDWPTVVLHWTLVGALLTSLLTGWRMARLNADNAWLRWLDAILLQGNVPRWHFITAVVLLAAFFGYLAFLARTRLGSRLTLRWANLRSADSNTRWQAVNRLLYWIAIGLLVGAGVSGVMLYLVPSWVETSMLTTVHRWLSWAFLPYVALHVGAQFVRGGWPQILKLVSPRMAYGIGGAFALAAGSAVAAVALLTDRAAMPALHVVKAHTLPVLDGDASDEVWSTAPEALIHTSHGLFTANGSEVPVHVRALHDGRHAYLLFRWPDKTFSQKHIPLQKTAEGWKLVNTDYARNDENDYYEDKFAVMLARSPAMAGNSVNLGTKPVDGKPGPTNGLGLHATSDGSLADVWHWKSVRSGSLNQFDDNHFGAPLPAKAGERYTGGYTQDPKTGGGFDQNFSKIEGSTFVKPKVLPRDLAAQLARQGRFDPDPEHSDEGVFAMRREDTLPYTKALDDAIPVGTVIPSVVLDAPFEGDRGDVSAHARWKDGWWTIEAKRLLDTGSTFDQPIADGVFMWVSVFDHNQVRHTRHIQPLRIALQ
jgi:Ethylbenzene dehydrogenase/Prokaryotic cytochrome b561